MIVFVIIKRYFYSDY